MLGKKQPSVTMCQTTILKKGTPSSFLFFFFLREDAKHFFIFFWGGAKTLCGFPLTHHQGHTFQ